LIIKGYKMFTDKELEYRKKYQLETKNSNKEWRLTIKERKEHERLYNKKYYENQKKHILGNIV